MTTKPITAIERVGHTGGAVLRTLGTRTLLNRREVADLIRELADLQAVHDND